MDNFFRKWLVAYYEIVNWLDVIKIINKHKKTADWSKFNLRSDWVGRSFTVLNPQSPGDDGDSDDVLKIKYAERLKPINLYLDKIGLGPSVYVAYDRPKENTRSLLVIWVPIFEVITTFRVLLFLTFIIAFFYYRLYEYFFQFYTFVNRIISEF